MTLTDLTRRERKKEETRRRIFDAAIALFREKGFEATTVDEITERADVGRGTFFNYFPKKENVLAFLSEEKLVIAEEHASQLMAETAPVREKLLELYSLAGSAYEDDRELARWVFNEWMQRAFSPTHDASRRWEKLIQALLEQGRASGQLRTDVSPLRTEALLSSVYMATVYGWLMCPEDCLKELDIESLSGEL